MTYVVTTGGGRSRLVTADFYNYWPGKPFVTFWANVNGKDVVVETIRLEPGTAIRPR